MEIRDYLRRIGPRLWILAIVPIASAGVTFSLLDRQPQRYEASTTITIPTSLTRANGSMISIYADNFEQAVRSTDVVRQVSSETGVSRAAIRSGVKTRRIGNSSLIRMTYSGVRQDSVLAVVSALARVSLRSLAEPEIIAAKYAVTPAMQRYATARKAIAAFYTETGLILPRERYQSRAAELDRLGATLEDARRAGSPEVPALEAAFAQRRQELGDLGKEVLRFQALQDNLDASLTNLRAAQINLQDATALRDLSSSRSVLGSPTVVPIQRSATIAKGTGVAAVVALMLVLAGIVTLDLLAQPRRQPRGWEPRHADSGAVGPRPRALHRRALR
jgi:hypothetical protein